MRLIDADALRTSIRESIEECHKWANEIHDGEMYARVSQSIGTFVECSLRIKNAPTVDAVVRKSGRWVLDDNPHDGDCRCSVCRIAIDQMHERNHGLLNALTSGKWWTFYKFCPNCGAEMKGD